MSAVTMAALKDGLTAAWKVGYLVAYLESTRAAYWAVLTDSPWVARWAEKKVASRDSTSVEH